MQMSSGSQSSSMSSDQLQRMGQIFPLPEAFLSTIPQYQSALTQSQGQLYPYTQAGQQSINQYLQALGMPGLDPLQQQATNLQSAIQQLQGPTLQSRYLSTFPGATSTSGISGASGAGLGGDTVQAPNDNQWDTVQAQMAQVISPLQQASLNLTKALGSSDDALRQQLVGEALTSLNSAGSLFGGESPLGAQFKDNAQLSGIFSNAQNLINTSIAGLQGASTNAPRAMSGEELTQNLQNTPGYQFQFDQGQKALTNSLAAKGLLNSGAAVKAMERYGQGLATTNYQQYLDNLARGAGLGANAASQNASNTLGTTNAIAQSMLGAGSQWYMSPWSSAAHSESQSSGSQFGFGIS